ncbi:MAG: radical SAM/SPASM domain-containing protein [Vicinamibacteria bacterium]
MSTVIDRLKSAARGLFAAGDALRLELGPGGPGGPIRVPSAGDGVHETRLVQGRLCLAPDERSHYLYFVLPEEFRARAASGLHVLVEYHGDRYGEFRLQYAARDGGAEHEGLYKPAEQRFVPGDQGIRRFRQALFPLPDFDPSRAQNHGASFRLEFRRELVLAGLQVSLRPPDDAARFTQVAPLPELRKLPGRFYPINYLFLEITNACNFKCTWCPDEIMDRRRGFMKKEQAFQVIDELAEKRPWLGPIYPIKLHQMGEPMLHPELPEIVAHAESRGVPIELNTNCGLITPERVDALYRAGLTNLILSYQTPDATSFKTRKAPRISFEAYRDKVRLAVERKVASKARTRIEIDVMNTKHVTDFHIVSDDDVARDLLEDWIDFCQELERRYGLEPRPHDKRGLRGEAFLDKDEDTARYTLLDGVTLIWKRCHSWGNVVGGHQITEVPDTYCPAPYDQFVILWNGDVVACCTDFEARTKHSNVFAESVESVWTGERLRGRKRDMLEGRLLDVCATCQGLK